MSASAQFGVWAPPQTQLEIEYSLSVLEEIRRAVLDGLQSFSRGMEVGGILFGVEDSGRVRIDAMREISCEHAYGPLFQLSETDKSTLAKRLEETSRDPALRGLMPLGWFVSHPRRDLALQPADLEVFRTFFPSPHQITLVVRPGRGGNMRGGFFVREPDGTIKADRSHLDFGFPEAAAIPPTQGASPAPSPRASREVPVERSWDIAEPASTIPPLASEPPRSFGEPARSFGEPPRSSGEPPRSSGEPPPTDEPSAMFSGVLSKRALLWLTTGAVVIIFASFAVPKYLGPKAPPDPLMLSVLDQSGQLQIQWNHDARTIALARSGSLEIIDGQDRRTFPLSPQELRSGSYTYSRKTGDVQVRLGVTPTSGEKAQEASRFLGSAPVQQPVAAPIAAKPAAPIAANPVVPEAAPASSAELRALRAENARLRARTQQLQRTLVILQGRLGITEDKGYGK